MRAAGSASPPAGCSSRMASTRACTWSRRPRSRGQITGRPGSDWASRTRSATEFDRDSTATGYRGDRRAGVRDVRGVRGRVGARHRAPCRRRRTSTFPIGSACSPRSRRRRALIYLTDPNNPTGLADPGRRRRTDRRGRAARLRPRRRGVCRIQRPHAHRPGARSTPQSRRRPHVCEGARPGGTAGRRARRAPGHARAAPPAPAALQRQHLRRRARSKRRSTIAPIVDGYVAQPRQSRELIYDWCRRARAPASGRARPTSCSCEIGATRPRSCARSPRAASSSATESPQPGCAGCVRITAGIVEHTRARARGAGGRPCVARALIAGRRRRACACGSTLDGRGRYDIATGIRFLDHMLELVARHGGFDLTITRQRRSRRRRASHRRGRRHRARRGGRGARSARSAASIAPGTS